MNCIFPIAQTNAIDTSQLCHGTSLAFGYELLSSGSPEAHDYWLNTTGSEKQLERYQFFYQGNYLRSIYQRFTELASKEGNNSSFFSPFYCASLFDYDAKNQSYEKLSEMVKTLLKINETVNKFVYFCNGDHAFGLYYQDQRCYPTDGALDNDLTRPFSLDQFENFSKIIYAHAEGQPISLAVKVLTTVDISKEVGTSLGKSYLKSGKAYNGYYPFYLAASMGEFDAAKELKKLGDPVDAADHRGQTVLYQNAGFGQLDTLRFLIQHQANVNVVYEEDNQKITPLILSSFNGHQKVVKLLLQEKADLDLGELHPREAALLNGHEQIAAEIDRLEISKINKGGQDKQDQAG